MWGICLFTLSFEMMFNTYMWDLTFYCFPSLWDDIQCVHVRHLALHTLFEMIFNTYMWDIWSFTYTFELMSNTYMWDIWLIIYTFEMMFNTYIHVPFGRLPIPLRWCSIRTCETFWPFTYTFEMMFNTYMWDILAVYLYLWDDVQYEHVRHFGRLPIPLRWCSIRTCETFWPFTYTFKMMFNTYMWDILAVYLYPWDDVQYVHVGHLAVYALFEMMSNTYMWDIWLFTLRPLFGMMFNK